MIVELIPVGGLGRVTPLRVEVNQIVVRQDNGTIICVAAEYGPEKSQLVSMVGQPDFERTLQALGIAERVMCSTIETPRAGRGAVPIAGPTFRR
jgi:hypothetical protein